MTRAHGMETTWIAPVSTEEAIRVLTGKTCPFCGGPKTRGYTFCRVCFDQLTPGIQSSLYQAVGRGFEKAYVVAGQWLREVNEG